MVGAAVPQARLFCDRIANLFRHPAQFYVLAIKSVSILWRSITTICLFVSFASEYNEPLVDVIIPIEGALIIQKDLLSTSVLFALMV